MIWDVYEVKGYVQGQLWGQLTTIYKMIVRNCLETNVQFLVFGMALRMGNVFPKSIAKNGCELY